MDAKGVLTTSVVPRGACPASVGSYRVADAGGGLVFTVVSDSCAWRSRLLTAQTWIPGPVSVPG